MSGNRSANAVRVGVRVRPLLGREIKGNNKEIITHPIKTQVRCNDNVTFTYDHVFSTSTTQEELYNESIKPLLRSLQDGYNVTILAYGQTGSGKSYTIGSCYGLVINAEETGCIPRVLHDIFNTKDSSDFSVSFLEVYGDSLRDLLSHHHNSNNNPPLLVREGKNNCIFVENLTERPVATAAAALEFLKLGTTSRVTQATAMNDTSSRSHAVFTLLNKTNGAKLTFVDLAGSERLKRTMAAGDRMKEGIDINVGLLALGNVINALGTATANNNDEAVVSHVPYRSSKLTRLLSDALGGNSKTLFLACVSPSFDSMHETLNTLKYANRARNITNAVVRNVVTEKDKMAELKSHIKFLTQEVLGIKFGNDASFILPSRLKKESRQVAAFYSKLLLKKPSRDYLKLLQSTIGSFTSFGADVVPNPDETDSSCSSSINETSVDEMNTSLIVIEELMEMESKESDYKKAHASDAVAIESTDSRITSSSLRLSALGFDENTLALVKETVDKLRRDITTLEAGDSSPTKLQQLLKELVAANTKLATITKTAEAASNLQSTITSLKSQRLTLQNRSRQRTLQHQELMKIKEREISALRKSGRKHERRVNVAELVSRHKETVLRNRNVAITKIASKLKATEAALLEHLVNKSSPRHDKNSDDIILKFVANIKQRLAMDNIKADLATELRIRGTLLQEVITCINRREELDDNNQVLVDECDVTLQAKELALEECEHQIEELSGILNNYSGILSFDEAIADVLNNNSELLSMEAVLNRLVYEISVTDSSVRQNALNDESECNVAVIEKELPKDTSTELEEVKQLNEKLKEQLEQKNDAMEFVTECQRLWKDVGLPASDQSTRLNRIYNVVSTTCENEIQEMKDFKNSLLDSISSLKNEIALVSESLRIIPNDADDEFSNLLLIEEKEFYQKKLLKLQQEAEENRKILQDYYCKINEIVAALGEDSGLQVELDYDRLDAEHISNVKSIYDKVNGVKNERVQVVTKSISHSRQLVLEMDLSQSKLEKCFDENVGNSMQLVYQTGGKLLISLNEIKVLHFIEKMVQEIYDGRVSEYSRFFKENNNTSSTDEVVLYSVTGFNTLVTEFDNLVLDVTRTADASLVLLYNDLQNAGFEEDSAIKEFVKNTLHNTETKYDKVLCKWFNESYDEVSETTTPEDTLTVLFSSKDPELDDLKDYISVATSASEEVRMQEARAYATSATEVVSIVRPKLDVILKVIRYLDEIRTLNVKIKEFEVRASDKDRLFDRSGGSSRRLLEEAKFRKNASRRYPMLVKALRREVEGWREENDYFDFSVLGSDLEALLTDTMETKTNLMHLNLSMVDVKKNSRKSLGGKVEEVCPASPVVVSSSSKRMVQTERKKKPASNNNT